MMKFSLIMGSYEKGSLQRRQIPDVFSGTLFRKFKDEVLNEFETFLFSAFNDKHKREN